jgi:hypothetical protein
MPSERDIGLLVGILIGEGSFTGTGRHPQVTLRMHVRHRALFAWIMSTFPGGQLYGPYEHGGRRYLQWMARGRFLRDELVPLLAQHITPELDEHVHGRLAAMCATYRIDLPSPGVDRAGST